MLSFPLDLLVPVAVTRRPPTKHASATPTSELQPARANLPVNFQKKPPTQTMIAAAEPGSLPTSRILFIIDLNNRLRFLIDSEAEISVIPPTPSERLTPNPNFVLQAVNRLNKKTYGQKLLELDMGLR